MSLIWWILPSIAGVLGLILLFAGFAKMAGLKPFAGVTRLAFGSGFLGLAGVIAFAGLNIQTYKRLTYERPVATIKFSAVPDQTDTYRADVVFSDGQTLLQADGTAPVFRGNEWQIGQLLTDAQQCNRHHRLVDGIEEIHRHQADDHLARTRQAVRTAACRAGGGAGSTHCQAPSIWPPSTAIV